MSTKNCPSCGAPISLDTTECKYCGEKIAVSQPQYAPPQVPQYAPPIYTPPANTSNKNKTTAGILAIALGGFGAHKFYLGKIGLGILYLLFCWTYIPIIAGVIEGIIYLTSNDETFYNKYVKK